MVAGIDMSVCAPSLFDPHFDRNLSLPFIHFGVCFVTQLRISHPFTLIVSNSICDGTIFSLLQECATQGSLIPISKHAQTKLEVCLYSFLWSPDAEAVLVAMSCFRHLCEEADIRCSVDELPVHTVLPNYNTFMEFASVSNMMATGQKKKKIYGRCWDCKSHIL